MKGVQGIILAVGLGLVGAVWNWFYLTKKAQEVERVEFLGIATEAQVKAGERFTEKDFVPVAIPKRSVGKLIDFAVLFEARSTVVGLNASRSYEGGELILRQDLRTAPQELKVPAGETVIYVAVDSKSFIPEHFNPGDQVSFYATGGKDKPVVHGPFVLASIGNRIASPGAFKASKSAPVQTNTLGVRVKFDNNAFDPKAAQLLEVVQNVDSRLLRVFKHAPDKDRPAP